MSQLGFILSICPLTHRWGLESANQDADGDRMPLITDAETAGTIVKGREAADKADCEQSGDRYHADHYYFVPFNAILSLTPETPSEVDPKYHKPLAEEDKMRAFLLDTLGDDGPAAVADFDKYLKEGKRRDEAIAEAMSSDRMVRSYKAIGGDNPLISSMLGSLLGRTTSQVRASRGKPKTQPKPDRETFRDEETPANPN